MIKIKNPIIGRKIKIAIVGCGRISKNHINSILIHKNSAELVALCDPVDANVNNALEIIKEQKLSKESLFCNPIIFNNYKDLLENIRQNKIYIDLIVLATPSGFHASQVVSGSELGVHMCSEKPMATKWRDGKIMVEACKKANVNLFVVKQNRLNTTLQLLKKQIEQNKFGKIALVTINVFWQRPQSYYDQDEWRGTWELDGGCLMNQASHYVDLLDWLIGPIDTLDANTATIGRKIEVEDTATLNLKWKNGTLGTMAVTMLAYPKNIEGSITILGENGTAKIGGKAVNQIEIWEFKDSNLSDKEIEEASYQTSSVYGFGHPAYYKNMIDTLRGKATPLCSGEDGLKSLELLIASYRSSKTGMKIKLPLVD